VLGTHFRPAQVIATGPDGPTGVFAADVNGDQVLDVLSISFFNHQLAWYENTNRRGAFAPSSLISTEFSGGEHVVAADLNGDGNVDVLSASSADGKIAWVPNTGGGTFGPGQVINPLAPQAAFVLAADLDRDQDLDVLYTARAMNTLAWHENLDGLGTFGPIQIISAEIGGASSAFVGDLDRDGDPDVIVTAETDNRITWYANTDGQGSFGPPLTITSNVEGPVAVFLADLDQDGDLDILSASRQDRKIAWYQNMDGLGGFGLQKPIDTRLRDAATVYAADLDQDGDQDVVAAGVEAIVWYENEGGGRFGGAQAIHAQAGGPFAIFPADVDHDGDVDVLAAARKGDEVMWFENLTPHTIFLPILARSE
jgi:hypothetical protein